MKSFKEALKTLRCSKTFKDWAKKNKSCYLSYGFYVIDKTDTNWKIGYYDSKKDKITSFDIGNEIRVEPDEEILKEERKKVEEIDTKEIKLDLAEAVSLANSIQKEEYVMENPIKVLAILQNQESNNIWNITFLTQNFNTLNFKIKADTGRILDKKLTGLMSLGTMVKGNKE